MPYDAITIDTNVAYGNGFDFEGGMLAQLSQFATSETKFVVSDIVVQEIYRRLIAMAQSSRDKFEKASHEALERQVLLADTSETVQALIAGLAEARPAARARLDAFLKASGAEVIGVEHASMVQLIKLYFAPTPPFEATGAKKSEFPDAIALLSLEAWARAGGRRILAVSTDNGWKEFAAQSAQIDVVEHLAGALEILQEQAAVAHATAAIGALLARVMAGELPELGERLTSRLEFSVENLDLTAEGDSQHHFEAELVGVQFRSFEFLEGVGDALDITIVRLDAEEAAFRAGVAIKARVEASFSLEHWDSVDKEYVSLGSTHALKDVEFVAGALITLLGDLADPGGIEVDDVELVDAIDSVDFGEIEMDRGDDYYEL